MFVIRVEWKRMFEMQVGDRDSSWSGSKSQCFALRVSRIQSHAAFWEKKEMCTTQSGSTKIEKRFKGRSRCHNESGGESEPIWHPLYQQRTCFVRAIPIASAISCWCIKECSCKVREFFSHFAATFKLWMQGLMTFVAELEEEKGFNRFPDRKDS